MMELAVASEVLQQAPGTYRKVRDGLAVLKERVKSLQSTLSGDNVEDLQKEVARLAEELENLVERMEELEDQIEFQSKNDKLNQEIFESVWTWSQQGWWKRAFTRPAMPKGRIWRNSGE
jgi:uncharacterized coiled-coil protein SlyX